MLKGKVVGLSFHKTNKAVSDGDILTIQADLENKFDKDALAVFNDDNELVGYIANSDKTLFKGNRDKGNISASEMKMIYDFTQSYKAVAIKAHKSCIFVAVMKNEL